MANSYRKLAPYDPGYDRVKALLNRGVWACDSYDHNEAGGCSNPDCFKHHLNLGREEWKPPFKLGDV